MNQHHVWLTNSAKALYVVAPGSPVTNFVLVGESGLRTVSAVLMPHSLVSCTPPGLCRLLSQLARPPPL